MINVSDIFNANNDNNQKTDCEVKVENFQKMCRLCLLEDEVTNIFELHYEGHFLSDLIYYCCSVQIIKDDPYPQNVCASCITHLISSFEFIHKCCNSSELLKSALNRENKPDMVKLIESEFDIKEEDADSADLNTELSENSGCGVNESTRIRSGKLLEPKNERDGTTSRKNSLESKNVRGRITSKESAGKKKNGLYSGPPFICQECGDRYEQLENLIAHRKAARHLKPRNFACTLCTKTFTCQDNLTQHTRSHTKEKPYQCELCFSRFSLNRNLKRHVMIHTGEKPFTCDVCGRGFNQRISLKEHKLVHTGERPYICNYCGKGLKRSTELKAHLARHLVDDEEEEHTVKGEGDGNILMKLECNICRKSVSSKHALRIHKSVAHGKKSYLCSICGKGFVGKQGLLSHMKTHTGEKPFSCEFCEKSFAHKMSLKDHILIHTGEKPHCCKICGKKFIQHHHLTHHMRTHTGERPYACPFCERAFALKGNLTVHIRIHTGETPYVCSTCDMGFYDSSTLRKHQRTHANDDVEVQVDC